MFHSERGELENSGSPDITRQTEEDSMGSEEKEATKREKNTAHY